MKNVLILAIVFAAALSACGDRSAASQSTQANGPDAPVKSEPPPSAPEGAVKRPAAEAAQGVTGKEIALCAAEVNTVKRLECYDRLAARHDLAPSETVTPPANNGNWRTRTSTDPLTDKSIHSALLTADSGKGRYGDSITLVIRCQNNRTEAYIDWNTFLGSDDIIVTSRIDKSPAVTSRWGISTDHKASFMPSAAAASKGFIGATSFVANLTPYSESPITAVFDITGAEQALADISKGCNWQP